VEAVRDALGRQGPKSGDSRALREGDDVAEERMLASEARPVANVKVEDTATENANVCQDNLLDESERLEAGVRWQTRVHAGQRAFGNVPATQRSAAVGAGTHNNSVSSSDHAGRFEAIAAPGCGIVVDGMGMPRDVRSPWQVGQEELKAR
jgi:hypothetical protein